MLPRNRCDAFMTAFTLSIDLFIGVLYPLSHSIMDR